MVGTNNLNLPLKIEPPYAIEVKAKLRSTKWFRRRPVFNPTTDESHHESTIGKFETIWSQSNYGQTPSVQPLFFSSGISENFAGINPLRLGICTFTSVCAFITSVS
jgi:hypothetical protein